MRAPGLRWWDGEQIILRRDAPTGAWVIIAIHSTRLGPARGGTRMRAYPSLDDAIVDAAALAAGMSLKFAAANFPSGGGKAVIALPPALALDGAARDELLRRYGARVRALGGLFETGPDVGTSPRDMDIIAERGAPHVFCRTAAHGGPGDSAPFTALGVYTAIERLCRRRGSAGVAGRHVAVQGIGSVGAELLRRLLAGGARVTVADRDVACVERVAALAGVSVVACDAIYDVPCDVFAPCALGGVLNPETIPRLRCGAIAGAANNQLRAPEDAALLQARGVEYAPDFVVNVGGALAITAIESMGWTATRASEAVTQAVASNVELVLDTSRRTGETPDAVARAVARERLASPASA